jgi:hypothetical protein
MVNPADFISLFRKGLKLHAGYKVIKGVPADAEIITVTYDNLRNAIVVVVQSETYEEVEPGVMPPIQVVDINVKE